MPKEGEIRKFNESQKTAVTLLKEKMEMYQERLNQIRQDFSNLMVAISKEMNIPPQEAMNWKLKKEADGYVWREPKKPPNETPPS